MQLSNNKAPEEDCINNMALKHLPDNTINTLTNIIQAILKCAHYPATQKTAKIIPILKQHKPPGNPTSYRPISLLNGTAKIIEKIIYKEIEQYLETNNLLNPNQHGFRKNYSTTTQLKRIYSTIIEAKANKKTTVTVMIDLEKAFDKVRHDILIYKMLALKIDPHTIKLIKSYLHQRSFFVYLNSAKSKLHIAESGVPQGSCLGPLLFLIFINDLKPSPSTNVKHFLYADDTAFISQHHKPSVAIRLATEELIRVTSYFTNFAMTINVAKT